jgi:hypothetical protein
MKKYKTKMYKASTEAYENDTWIYFGETIEHPQGNLIELEDGDIKTLVSLLDGAKARMLPDEIELIHKLIGKELPEVKED